jgi:kynurenine formamidase
MRESTAPPGAFVDLSHTIHSGMITYPGLPGPVINDLSRDAASEHYAEGTTFHIGQIMMVRGLGTFPVRAFAINDR